MQACEELGCRIDYLATHDYDGNANHVMNKLEDLYHRYGKKIWLTEFAVCCTRDEQDVINFVKVKSNVCAVKSRINCRTLYHDWRVQNMCSDTPGSSPGTMTNITEKETGILTLSTASSSMVAQNCLKLVSSTILCNQVIDIN